MVLNEKSGHVFFLMGFPFLIGALEKDGDGPITPHHYHWSFCNIFRMFLSWKIGRELANEEAALGSRVW